MTAHRTALPVSGRWDDDAATRTAAGASPIRVVVVDDETLTRIGFELILDQDPELKVVAAVGSAEAPTAVAQHRPEVVLLDVRMPGPDDLDGPAVLRQLRSLPDPPQVAMLTSLDSEDCIAAALDAGASGFLLKDTPSKHLTQLVRSLATGATVLSRTVGRTVAAGYARLPHLDLEAARQVEELTLRERQVLTLPAEGPTNADIARRLDLKVGTVKEHVSSVLAGLGVTNRVQAALIAQRAGRVRDT